MTKQFCENHSQIAFQVERLTMRMDRIEVGIVAILLALVVNLWMLWDLPGQIQQDRRRDKIVSDANAETR